ncbi:MAG: phage tail assembly chaperone [Alphaproteobacteria bacterium]|nr:phage tail assembly chaperone [Alphaproteobacteria bacterium]
MRSRRARRCRDASVRRRGGGHRAPFRWRACLSFALGRLHLPPATFWSLSLPEWRALIAPYTQAAPLTRAGLKRLMEEHPDL